MDPAAPSSTGRRVSGIPRPSKLPLPKSSIPVPTAQPRNPPSVDRLSKQPSRTSLRKAPSLSVLTAAQSVTKPLSRPSTLTGTTKLASATKSVPKKDDSVFKRPMGRPPSRQARMQQPVTARSMASEAEDTLGALQMSRPASRMDSRPSSRVDSRPSSRIGHVDDEETSPVLGEFQETPKVRKSRPSLSDRTIETLSAIPPSPAVRRRQSGFFTSESPMRPPSRSASAMNSYSRPGTSDGSIPNQGLFQPDTPSRRAQGPRTIAATPTKRSVSSTLPTSYFTPSQASSSVVATGTPATLKTKGSQTGLRLPPRQSLTGTQTVGAKPANPRPAIGTVFASSKAPSKLAGSKTTPSRVGSKSFRDDSPDAKTKAQSSSVALREQIAKAKAARKTKPIQQESAPVDAGFEFDFNDDPFNQNPKGAQGLLTKRIDSARRDGRLNLAAMNLQEIPEDVLKMYEFDPEGGSSMAWGEVVDLVRIVAADNQITTIPDGMFPDVEIDTSNFDFDEQDPAPLFAGIETLDLHGNKLSMLPIGLRRLQRLTTLNLSRNQLVSTSLDVICQIEPLRDLKLSDNKIEGCLPDLFSQLRNLESLDLRNNQLSDLPNQLQELTQLRVLNVANNRLHAISATLLSQLNLTELNVSNNSLSGTLFTTNDVSLPRLQILNASSNKITSICDGSVQLPTLQNLNVSNNRLQIFPDVSEWTSLVTIVAGDNKLMELPPGFTSLSALRTADFTSNDITKTDSAIGLMGSLESLLLASNPLRERKYLTMATDEMKRSLQSKLGTGETTSDMVNLPANEDQGLQEHQTTSQWTLKPSGLLDLSSRNLTTLDEQEFTEYCASHDVRQLNLQHNLFESIPTFIEVATHLTSLNMSNNNLAVLSKSPLHLPYLRELRLAANKLSAFELVSTIIDAPNLEHLDVTYNRLCGSLPILCTQYPKLSVLLAADNSVEEISSLALEGLRTVDLSGNDIGRLPPEIGLLAGRLVSLNVDGNRFRVPGYAILQKGTATLLGWLKDKIPEAG